MGKSKIPPPTVAGRPGLTPSHPDALPVVYFVESKGLVKIGCTANLPQRLQALSIGGLDLTLLATVPGGFQTEAALHRWLHHDRETGEWFIPSEALAAAVHTARRVSASSSTYHQARQAFLAVVKLSLRCQQAA